MMRRRRYQAETKRHSTFLLNITPMCDMFTIMLVFLLQSYSTSLVEIKTEPGMRVPASNSELNPIHGVQVVLSKDALKINERTIASVSDRQIDPKDIDAKDSQFIPSLFRELDAMMKDEQAKPEVKEGRILFLADASLPYATLRKVMYTSSMAGFAQMKLVTTVGN